MYDQLKRRFPTLSLATVYKTMETLRSMGEVLYLEFKEGSTRYDGRFPFPHTHLICSKCSRIEDIVHDPVTPDLSRAVTQSGFELAKYRFDIYGLCKDCQKKSARAS
jgi:Fur family peroxide stress response transcriptional regulator